MNLNGKTQENQAHGLPNTYYTDPTIQAREFRNIFQQAWQIVGRVEALANSGDYLTCMVVDLYDCRGATGGGAQPGRTVARHARRLRSPWHASGRGLWQL